MIYYKIDGMDERFLSIRNAKKFVCLLNHEDRLSKFKSAFIRKYKDDVVLTETPIFVMNDSLMFGKTQKTKDYERI